MKSAIFLLALVGLLTVTVNSQAQMPSGKANSSRPDIYRNPNNIAENNLKVALGLDRGAVNMGAEYEVRTGSAGYSGYFLMASEKAAISKNQVIVLGAGIPIYFYDNRVHSVSVTPGFGLNMVKTATSTETTLGAQLKLTTGYRLSPLMRVGVEHFIITNWLSDKAPGDQSFTQVVLGFTL